jgi:hypothetical protein
LRFGSRQRSLRPVAGFGARRARMGAPEAAAVARPFGNWSVSPPFVCVSAGAGLGWLGRMASGLLRRMVFGPCGLICHLDPWAHSISKHILVHLRGIIGLPNQACAFSMTFFIFIFLFLIFKNMLLASNFAKLYYNRLIT